MFIYIYTHTIYIYTHTHTHIPGNGIPVVYASPPLTGAKKRKMQSPLKHKNFAPVCAKMIWMRPSSPPAAMTSPAGPYCTL